MVPAARLRLFESLRPVVPADARRSGRGVRGARLAHWPVRKVFAAALGGLSDKAAERLGRLVTTLGLAPMQGARQVTVDLDSSVIVSFGEQEGAVFGYCGKGRNRRRHHPLVASVQGARTVVHAD